MHRCLLFILLFFTLPLTYASPLPAEQVFQVSAKKIDPNTFTLEWHIKPGYFLYSKRLQLDNQSTDFFHLGTLHFPKALKKTNRQGQIDWVYQGQLVLPISVLGLQPGEGLVNLQYQGCSEEGFCYPPEHKQIQLSINKDLALSGVLLESVSPQEKPVIQSQEAELSELFNQHHWLISLFIFFGLGLLLSFTPCILPMIPVLSGIIVGHGEKLTTRKAFLLSLSYVLSMSVTYALMGAVIALIGENLQLRMQSPWVISLFSLLFIILALSMFGLYELKLPNSWQTKIMGSNTTKSSGHYWSAMLMGCLSILILSPCVTPPLIGVLTYIAQSHNVFFGSLSLFFLSLGMGTPLLLLGISAGKWLPRTGSWMNGVKAFFGILLIAVAIYLMARILPANLIMFFWACLFIFSGIFAGALARPNSNQERFLQALGIILLSYGLIVLIGASQGSTNLFQPLTRAEPKVLTVKEVQEEKKLTLNELQTLIKEQGKPVILDFYASWCASCKVMEETVFKNEAVIQALNAFKIIKVDLSAQDLQDKEIMDYFKDIAPPTFSFFNEQGQEQESLKLVGEVTASEFLNHLAFR